MMTNREWLAAMLGGLNPQDAARLMAGLTVMMDSQDLYICERQWLKWLEKERETDD